MADWYNAERVAYKGSVILDRWNAERQAARQAAAPQLRQLPRSAARFHAARVDRLTAGWLATQNSINQELRGDLDRLRARSRDLSKNNDYARKFKKMWIGNIVGPVGFKLQSRVMNTATTADQLACDAIEAAFANWSVAADVTGAMSFEDLCRAVAGDVAIDGEYLLRKVRGKDAGNAFGFALQHLDVDRLDTQMNVAAGRGQNAVVMGIEIDRYRRPLAYHLFTSHPNDGIAGGRERERVPAADILHGFVVEYPEQVRGVPAMSAAILTLHHLGEFEQSALLAARKGADTLGFFVSPDGTPPPMDGSTDGDEPITVSVPGHYDTLPDGYDFKAYDSRYPDAMLEAFCKNFVRRAASGLNVAYNSLSSDLEGVNFSSIRSGVIEERDQWMLLQNWFAGKLLKPIFLEWLSLALLSGAIVLPNGSSLPASRRDKFTPHQWQGRRWAWVDPVKDIEASLLAIRAGLQSPYTIAGQMGLDLDDVVADLQRANAMAAAAGLPAYAAPTPAPVAPPAPAPVPADDASKTLQLALARSLMRDAPAPAAPNYHVTLNQGEVRTEITVPPTTAPTVINEIHEREQPPAEVHVTVEAIMPEQAAPNVDVHVEAVMPDEMKTTIISLPDRETTSTVTRDAANNIVKTTQRETDV